LGLGSSHFGISFKILPDLIPKPYLCPSVLAGQSRPRPNSPPERKGSQKENGYQGKKEAVTFITASFLLNLLHS
jgi:hypothetical protein